MTRLESFIKGIMFGMLLTALPAYWFGANAARQGICGKHGVELRGGEYRCVKGEKK